MQKTIYNIIFILAFIGQNTYARISINEIMQSNVYDIMDDLNEFPDSWVELYNDDSVSVSLYGFALGFTSNFSEAYVFQEDTIINPNDYIIIYCDKEAIGLHTNFRLNSDEDGSLLLFNDKREIEDSIFIPKMPAPNISYGKIIDQDNWSYFKKSTPCRKNEGVYSNYVLSKPKFSVKGGCYKDTVILKLSLDKNDKNIENIVIRYTTDGSEPTDSSNLYIDSLVLYKNTVVKAKTFHDSLISKPSKSNSYLFFDRDITLPIISLSLDSSYLYDDEIGIYVSGTYGKNHPEKISSVPLAGNDNFLFSWKRPVNFEFFNTKEQSEALINQLCEIKIGGNFSRKNEVKSLVLNANKRFGNKRFEYSFWKDKPNVKKNKSLYLRNGGNDFSNAMLRDVIAQMSVGTHVNVDWQAYQPVIVFINGEYRGILNLRERAHEDYVWANYNKENIDFISNATATIGDKKEWNKFVNKYNSSSTSYKEISESLDINEFLNFFITETFYANIDFPSNNSKKFRVREDSAKWRFFICDIDNSFGYKSSLKPTFPYLNYILRENPFKEISNSEVSCKMYQKMISLDTFRTQFIDRFSIYMGTFLSDTNVINLIDSIVADIEYEMPYYYEDVLGREMSHYYSAIESMQTWVKERIPFMYEHIGEFFGLGNPIPLNLEIPICDSLLFNNIYIENGIYRGMYYPQREFRLTSNSMKNLHLTVKSVYEDTILIDSFEQQDTFLYKISADAKSIIIKLDSIQNVEDNINSEEITMVHDRYSYKSDGEYIYIVSDIEGKKIRKSESYNSAIRGLSGMFIISKYEKGKLIKSYKKFLP